MSPPPAFQKLADLAVGGNHYSQLAALWQYVKEHWPDLAKKCEAVNVKGNIPGKVSTSLKEAMAAMKKWKKRKKGGKSAGNGASATTATTQREQPSEMELIGIEDVLWVPNGEGGLMPAQLVDADQFGPDSSGATVASANRIKTLIRMHRDEEPFPQAAAAICKKVAYVR